MNIFFIDFWTPYPKGDFVGLLNSCETHWQVPFRGFRGKKQRFM